MALITSALLIWFYMTAWYGWSIYKKRNDVADTAWGLGFIFVTIFNFIYNPSSKLLVSLILISIWGIRLAIHIYQRNKNIKEDSRYEVFKSSPYFKVFITQGFFMWLICFPVISSVSSLKLFNLFGIIIWLIGFYFESTADSQLKEFISNPVNKGKILQTGLWALSRHPNYFGEITMWWGIWLLNLSSNFWTIIGPLTITLLIWKVSGVPLLEKKYEGNQDYDNYKKRVPVLIPFHSRHSRQQMV
jgi:steroid 5-alpha reductase family enzyme